jgi:hypothetical protein
MAVAQKVIVELADDIDGSEASETLTFGLRGVEYEIDLSEANVASLEKALAPFVGHARRIGGRKKSGGTGTGGTPAGVNPRAVRAWAIEEGIEINVRGRIPQQIVEQYQAAR